MEGHKPSPVECGRQAGADVVAESVVNRLSQQHHQRDRQHRRCRNTQDPQQQEHCHDNQQKHLGYPDSSGQRQQQQHVYLQDQVATTTTPDHHLGAHEDDYLDDYDDVVSIDDSMTADSIKGAHRRTASPADSSMNRKSNKPMMEKKRRQRINRCLNDLKSLVLEGMKKDPSRYSKLEKADILEMTVRHVQALHRLEAGGRLLGGGRAMADEEGKYRAGFIHCAAEVAQYLASLNELPSELQKKVLNHLNTIASSVSASVNNNSTCVQNSINVVPNPAPIILVLNTTAGIPMSQPVTQSPPQPPTQAIAFQDNSGNSLGAQPQVTVVSTSPQKLPQQQQNQHQQQQPVSSLQIVPTRLVLPATHHLVPHSTNTSITTSTTNNNSRTTPSTSLQVSAPVLTAYLTSDRTHTSSSTVVQPPALSTTSEDSALGTETLDTSDSDMSCSGVSTPMSCISSASSPVPGEEAERSSPRRAGTSRSSPPLKSPMWPSMSFREELDTSSSYSSPSSRNSSTRRQSTLAPKPPSSYRSLSAQRPSLPSNQSSRKQREKSPSPPPPDIPQSMWRPWH